MKTLPLPVLSLFASRVLRQYDSHPLSSGRHSPEEDDEYLISAFQHKWIPLGAIITEL